MAEGVIKGKSIFWKWSRGTIPNIALKLCWESIESDVFNLCPQQTFGDGRKLVQIKS